MSFLYLNVGYAGLFDNTTFSDIQDMTYNNKNGVAVCNGHGTIILSNIPEFICGKFDFYVNSISSLNINIGVGGTLLSDGFFVKIDDHCVSYQDAYNTYQATELISVSYDNNLLHENELNSLWFYIASISDESYINGIFKMKINDNSVVNAYNVNCIFRKATVDIYSNNENIFLSNFILSDTTIESDYEVVSPNISIVAENINNINGLYHVSQKDQKIIQTINVDDLMSEYGNNADILGMVMAGISAYSNLDDIGAFCSIEKNNLNYVVGQRISLNSDSSNYIIDSRFLKNTNLLSMNNKKYGWIAKV